MGNQLRFFTIVVLISALVASCTSQAPPPEGLTIAKKIIIAHCSFSIKANKNTIELLEKAIDLGANMVEFDVRRTQDNVFIAYHDELIHGKPIQKLTYREICKIAQKQGFDILTVEEVLKYTSGKIELDVELKEKGYEKEVIELICKYFREDQFVITSFHDSSLKIIKDNHPHIRIGLLLGKYKPESPLLTRLSELFPMRRCAKVKADFLVAHWKLLRFGFLARAERNNPPVFVWTVSDEQMIWKFLHDERINAIITDRPDLDTSLREKILRQTSIESDLSQIQISLLSSPCLCGKYLRSSPSILSSGCFFLARQNSVQYTGTAGPRKFSETYYSKALVLS